MSVTSATLVSAMARSSLLSQRGRLLLSMLANLVLLGSLTSAQPAGRQLDVLLAGNEPGDSYSWPDAYPQLDSDVVNYDANGMTSRLKRRLIDVLRWTRRNAQVPADDDRSAPLKMMRLTKRAGDCRPPAGATLLLSILTGCRQDQAACMDEDLCDVRCRRPFCPRDEAAAGGEDDAPYEGDVLYTGRPRRRQGNFEHVTKRRDSNFERVTREAGADGNFGRIMKRAAGTRGDGGGGGNFERITKRSPGRLDEAAPTNFEHITKRSGNFERVTRGDGDEYLDGFRRDARFFGGRAGWMDGGADELSRESGELADLWRMLQTQEHHIFVV